MRVSIRIVTFAAGIASLSAAAFAYQETPIDSDGQIGVAPLAEGTARVTPFGGRGAADAAALRRAGATLVGESVPPSNEMDSVAYGAFGPPAPESI
ncbi:MAG: hypothetical protein RLZZ491_1325, partial [Pseudomonadota bacterium]